MDKLLLTQQRAIKKVVFSLKMCNNISYNCNNNSYNNNSYNNNNYNYNNNSNSNN